MNAARALLHPVGLGLLFGLLLALLLGNWFVGEAREGLSRDHMERGAIMHAMALADGVASLAASGAEDAVVRTGALAETWTGSHPQVSKIRVMRLRGSRLLASTVAADAAEKPLPRRLTRDEKAIFDQAQTLRAAAETNAEEGVFRKKQVAVEYLDRDSLRVSLPYFDAGRVAGMVQMEQNVERPHAGRSWPLAIITLLVPLCVFLVAAPLVARRETPPGAEPATGDKPWRLFLLALVLASLALYGFARSQLGGLEEMQRQLAQDLATQHGQMSAGMDAALGVVGPHLAADAVAPWDVDHYQRPHAIVLGDASLAQEVLAARVAGRTHLLGRGLLGNWFVGSLLLAFIALGYGRRLRETVVEHRDAYLYVTPAVLGMLVLVFFPFSFGMVLSFTGQTLFNADLPLSEIWIWFDNYIAILGDFDLAEKTPDGWAINYQNFYWTLYITICWTAVNLIIGVGLGLALALALNTQGLRFKTVYRVLLILPWAIPNYITALIWKGMFHPQFGVINQMILLFGGEPVAWFDGVFTSFLTGIITNGWLSFPFMMVVILGALQSISADMYEAARVEGASRWQQFRHITLPLLKPTLIPAIVISVVWTFNMFNIIYLVSEGQPAGANEILVTEAYKIAFQKYQYGYAAAYSVVVFIILLFYGVFQTRMTKATEAAA